MAIEKVDYSKVDFRFSFTLTINDIVTNEDIIICKRDFNINFIDESSLRSLELKECVDDIVGLVKRDLKSKSRVYTWYNYDENYITPEFSDPIPEEQVSTFKFTLYDNDKPIITKIWSGDEYPFTVRNSVDLTNKKYKYDNINVNNLDFVKQIAQKASADKQDLSVLIMKLINSTCSSVQSKQYNKKVIYRNYLPELLFENISLNGDGNWVENDNKLEYIEIIEGEDETKDKVIYEVYTNYYEVGDKEYDLVNLIDKRSGFWSNPKRKSYYSK